MQEIVFTVRVTEADWDDTMRGWRCPALSVPGAVVDAIYLEGNRADTARYEVLPAQGFVRWILPDQPQRAAVVIKLTQELSLGSETDRWKRRAIILPVLATVAAAVISGAATYFSRTPTIRMATVEEPATTHQPPRQSEAGAEGSPFRPSSDGAVDVIGKENTNISKALPVTLGTTYKSRFLNDGSSLYFLFLQQAAHDLRVELTLLSPDAQVRPAMAIYDEHGAKLFSRWHESRDGNRITWNVPVTAGKYFIEVKPDYTSGDFSQFLLLVAAST